MFISKQDNTKPKSADWSKAEFISTTVHELNNFLSAISGFAELSVMDLGEDSDLSRYLSEISLAVERNLEFNHQLLMMSGLNKPIFEKINAIFVNKTLKKYKFVLFENNHSQYHFQANKCWFEKSISAIQEFSNSVSSEVPQLSIVEQKESIEFKFRINLSGRKLDLNNFFQPYYSTRELVSQKGLGLCWLPALMKHIEGDVKVETCQQDAMVIYLTFKKI